MPSELQQVEWTSRRSAQLLGHVRVEPRRAAHGPQQNRRLGHAQDRGETPSPLGSGGSRQIVHVESEHLAAEEEQAQSA